MGADITAARIHLQRLVTGLREAASGVVLERAVAKIAEQVKAVSTAKATKHQATGAALASTVTTTSGGLVQMSTVGYLRFHTWWPFRSGMPPFVVSRAAKIVEAELVAALRGEPSPLITMDEEAEEAAAVKSRIKFKSDTAKIARRIFAESPAGKAAKKAAAAAKRLTKGGS